LAALQGENGREIKKSFSLSAAKESQGERSETGQESK